ncbi:hypothetical protein [Thiomicrospira microaerophila]|uniref:hypothetical protein n=1 Tax=Thiomicrospira microaerophila TaxID=406020 RepID=UPI0012FE7CC7|nr:hypothetical protein [Thiomicrospira microaerophila]
MPAACAVRCQKVFDALVITARLELLLLIDWMTRLLDNLEIKFKDYVERLG